MIMSPITLLSHWGITSTAATVEVVCFEQDRLTDSKPLQLCE